MKTFGKFAISTFVGAMMVAQGQAHAGDTVHILSAGQRYVINEPLLIHKSGTSIGTFNSMMIFLADQLERNIDRKTFGNTFIVSTFSNLDKLNETSPLGRLIGENIIHEMHVRRWNVVDVRMTRDIVINDTGEFSLSRDIKKIRDMYKVGGVVTGTYSVSEAGVIVNARAIDIDTGAVASTAQVLLPMSYVTESLLYDAEQMRPIRIVGDK